MNEKAAAVWKQQSQEEGAEQGKALEPPLASVLPETSPCEAAVRPMLVSRWSMLGTG